VGLTAPERVSFRSTDARRTEVDMKYCQQCGQQLLPTDRFCASCGAAAPIWPMKLDMPLMNGLLTSSGGMEAGPPMR